MTSLITLLIPFLGVFEMFDKCQFGWPSFDFAQCGTFAEKFFQIFTFESCSSFPGSFERGEGKREREKEKEKEKKARQSIKVAVEPFPKKEIPRNPIF